MVSSASIFRRRRHSALLTWLVIAVYLFVFLAHDVVFVEKPSVDPPVRDETESSALQTANPDAMAAAGKHHCPFCDGFVDTYIKLAMAFGDDAKLQRANPVVRIPHLSTVYSQHPRDPPSTNI